MPAARQSGSSGSEAGSLCWGPVFTQDRSAEAEAHYAVAKLGDGAIDPALRFSGVDKGTSRDEFDAAGLGRCRLTEEWLTSKG
ncbi:MAG TPA: hypothetical protein VME46_03370 [Acidimicrobiales bacterium]|nr:hypothetical protein [Acidimicrobiales bacterium]